MACFHLSMRRKFAYLFFLTFTIAASGCFLNRAGICVHPACRATRALGDACRVFVDAADGQASFHRSVIMGSYGGSPRTNPEGCYEQGEVYGLQGWRFNTRGGHKIGRLKLMQREDTIDFEMTDGDGNDYMDGFIWLVPLPGENIQRRETSAASCRGICRLPLDPMAEDDVFVLLGFDLDRVDTDGHVQRISVGPLRGARTAPTIDVRFEDDTFEYVATVQYAYLSTDSVESIDSVSSSYTKSFSGDELEPDLFRATPEGNAVLQGFSFAFRNGGHFLEDIGLERRRGAYEAWFQDEQGDDDRRHPDDPFDWEARFVMLP